MPARDKEGLAVLRSVFRDTVYICVSEAKYIFSSSWACVIDIQNTDLIAIATSRFSQPSVR
jgi:hypothetical protein